MLEVRNLVKHYAGPGGTVAAVDGVSLSVGRGQFIAVQGPSGCGKSTLLLSAGALLRPDQGTVTFDGTDPYAMSPGERAAFRGRRIGFVFQQFHLVPYLSALENVMVASMAATDWTREELRLRAMELLEFFGLADRALHVPSELSTGERQRIALARAVLNHPDVLLADEPTGNLDQANGEMILTHLANFVKGGPELGRGVLLVTHDPRAAQFATRTIKLRKGKIDE